MREEGVVVMVKGLSVCGNVDMSKELFYENSIFTWRFTNYDEDAEQFSLGPRLRIPSSFLSSHFSPLEEIFVEVSLNLGDGIVYSSTFSFRFLPGPVEYVLNNDPGSTISPMTTLTLDFSSSQTFDEALSLFSSSSWEWKWGCVNPLTWEECVYEDGTKLKMPEKNENIFTSNNNFIEGIPYYFIIYTRVGVGDEEGEEWEWVSRGKWGRVISIVGGGGGGVELELTEWRCLYGGGKYGYAFQVSPGYESQIKSTTFETILSGSMGNIQILNVEDYSGIAQFRCSCDVDCSEPTLIKSIIEDQNGKLHYLYGLFRPPPILPPQGGQCTSYYETNKGVQGEEGGGMISGLSFVVVGCSEWDFFDGGMGGVGVRVYYGEEGGEGTYPRMQTVFGPVQLTLPCGVNIIYSEVVGLGDHGVRYTTDIVTTSTVAAWTADMEDVYNDVQESISLSPNQYLQDVILYSTLKTMASDCFDAGSFTPIDANDVLDDILDSNAPSTIDDVLDEAPILAVVTDPDRSDEIIDRFNDYLEIALEQGDAETTETLSESIVNGVSNIISSTDNTNILDDSYDLLGNVETTLACAVQCGEEPVLVESEFVVVGAQASTIEQLASGPISLGDTGASFQLPGDLTDLEAVFGEGACVYTGTSLIDSNTSQGDVPAASFTFYTINCTTGEREEVVLTIDGEFLIYLPLPADYKNEEDECGNKENEVSCVSGDTLSNLDDSLGCRLIEILEEQNQIVCGCTHLTAFSALFVPGKGGKCGGEWEWDVLQTVAASLLALCVVLVVVFLVVEHNVVFKKRKKAIKSKTRRHKATQ